MHNVALVSEASQETAAGGVDGSPNAYPTSLCLFILFAGSCRAQGLLFGWFAMHKDSLYRGKSSFAAAM